MRLQNYPALLLNADYQPVRIHPLSTWGFDRTMRAVLKDRVTVLEEYDVELRAANFVYKPPSVIALKRYVKIPEGVAFTRLNIIVRDDFTCQYCGNRFPSDDLTFDHVIPRCRGGKTNALNIVAACVPCNSRKADKIIQPLRPPRPLDPREMARKVYAIKKDYHTDWLSYLYWSGVLEQEQE